MKAIIFHDTNHLTYEEVNDPGNDRRDWVTVKMQASGLCGSDVHKFLHTRPPKSFLRTNILGHEVAGTVVSIGSTVERIRVGDRVIIEPLIPCNECKNCLTKKHQLCINLKCIGRDYPGGFAEYVQVPQEQVWPLPSGLSSLQGSQVDPVAAVIHCIHLTNQESDAWNAAVIGDGPLGLISVQVLKSLGAANVTLFGKYDYRKEIALDLGANEVVSVKDESCYLRFSGAFDLVIEAVGGRQSDSLRGSIEVVAPGGTVGVLGAFDFGLSPTLPLRQAFYKEVRIVGSNSYSYWQGESEFGQAIRLIKDKQVDVEKIVSHIIPLNRYDIVLDMLREKERSRITKVVFEPE
jgi:threonine dehydrogenase-like Zn-dependent dehydrogenase